ncbi:DDE-type integrase/transposase/recombinase [Hoeflea sp. AS60]|uniref:DDE-type integrase/transposase/recombinase n=1 Tax=Hoeflea sp. AS60 TaxID=3135780 RepID=UPI0031802BE4
MFKGRHFDQLIILLCVRWYLAYGLSLRDLKEMMTERGIRVDHPTIHRWVVHFSPLILDRFNRRKRAVNGSQTNRETIISCDMIRRLQERRYIHTKPIRIRQSQYLNNRIEQDHRRIKRRVRPMLGFKAFSSATITLAGIEMVQMMRKRQGRYSYNPSPSLAEQFQALADAF